MFKLKAANCIVCGKRLLQHDEKRVWVKAGRGSCGQGAYKLAHLSCTQKKGEGEKVNAY